MVSATLGDLKELDEEEEEEEEDLSINMSTSPQSSLTSSFKNKFHLPFSARRSRVKVFFHLPHREKIVN